jgi:hypothetical protein
MQHDVFLHPLRCARSRYPYTVLLQSDYADGDQRLSAPLIPLGQKIAIRGVPIVAMKGAWFAVALLQVFALPPRVLRQPVGSIQA